MATILQLLAMLLLFGFSLYRWRKYGNTKVEDLPPKVRRSGILVTALALVIVLVEGVILYRR